MLEFLQLLKQRYQIIANTRNSNENQNTVFQKNLETLSLAESFLQKGRLIEENPVHSLQIAVIGPTQAGKSSVSNLLLGSKDAGVSPLAGFTVHPQAFCYGVEDKEYSWLKAYFKGFQQVTQSELTRNQYQCYSLTELDHNSSSPLPPAILWDTPDFDSIDAGGYQEGVLRTFALADIIVLVVSKEKYADQSVWDAMTLLAPLNQPTLIVVNKLVENSTAVILQSLQEKWRQARNDSFPEVIPLLYQSGGKLDEWPSDEFNRGVRLFKAAQKKSNRRKHSDYEHQLLNSHWKAWIEPVIAEHVVIKEWSRLLDECSKEALENYHRDFLNHPQHYETFQIALAKLLRLLEIPGLAGMLVTTRKILTWPVRQVAKLSGMGRTHEKLSDTSHEVELLNQISEHVLISVADKILDKIDQHPDQSQWWKELNSLLRKQRESILHSFQSSVKTYHAGFQEEIENIAHRLYYKLQEQPITLNSLRATRVTTDAAAVALALHTGGIGLHDLLITPAMLSITSLLAESALGGYMATVEAELKQKQSETVKQQLFNQSLKDRLSELPDMMALSGRFNISKEELHRAEQQLKEKKHGLRIF